MKDSSPLFIIGMPGAGKTTLARSLAEVTGIPAIDTDREIALTYTHGKDASSQTIQAIFKELGEAGFRNLERKVLHELPKKALIVSCGGGLPCFYDNMDYLLKSGYVIWLKPPLEKVLQQLEASDTKRPLIQQETDIEPITKLTRLQKKRNYYYKRAHLTIDHTEPKDLLPVLRRIFNVK